jgi:hypothetical protein
MRWYLEDYLQDPVPIGEDAVRTLHRTLDLLGSSMQCGLSLRFAPTVHAFAEGRARLAARRYSSSIAMRHDNPNQASCLVVAATDFKPRLYRLSDVPVPADGAGG